MKVQFTATTPKSRFVTYVSKDEVFDLDTELGQASLGFDKEEWLALPHDEKTDYVKTWTKDDYQCFYYKEFPNETAIS